MKVSLITFGKICIMVCCGAATLGYAVNKVVKTTDKAAKKIGDAMNKNIPDITIEVTKSKKK